jgi:hypothetical protein
MQPQVCVHQLCQYVLAQHACICVSMRVDGQKFSQLAIGIGVIFSWLCETTRTHKTISRRTSLVWTRVWGNLPIGALFWCLCTSLTCKLGSAGLSDMCFSEINHHNTIFTIGCLSWCGQMSSIYLILGSVPDPWHHFHESIFELWYGVWGHYKTHWTMHQFLVICRTGPMTRFVAKETWLAVCLFNS